MAKSIIIQDSNKSTEWYTEEQLDDLLQYYVSADNIYIPQALSTEEELFNHLGQLPQLNKAQYIIPLNSSALTGELDKGNHWVGLHILINNSSNSVVVNYINPMGFTINLNLKRIIKQTLSPLFTSIIIEQPLLHHGTQMVHQESNLELTGNLNDCGPMLVYIMACRARAIDPIRINSYEESISLGSFLRESFTKLESFNSIYSTFCKNDNNNPGPYKKEVSKFFFPLNTDKEISEPQNILHKKLESRNKEYKSNNEIEQKKNETLFDLVHSNYQAGNKFLREQYYDILFKEIIHNSAKDRAELAKIFMDIAKLHIELAEGAMPELKLQYYNDAATTCQYVFKLTEGSALKTVAYDTINLIQSAIVKLCDGNPGPLKEIKSQDDIDILCHKKQLQDLREQTKDSLRLIESYKENNERKAYINESALLFKEIAKGMERYLAGLFQEAENVIGPAPCKYSVIGLGSMALRQMTPYSDLEFAILTENDDYKQDHELKVKNYFRNLSHLVHFMVINLGETIIPTSKFDLDLSGFIPQAMNFDLGGKTPLGRLEKDKPYELIQTVNGMLHYLKNERAESEHIDKNLAHVLQKVCFVYGTPELAKAYQLEAQRFLEQINGTGKTNYESRAVKALWEGVEEFDYTKAAPSSKLIEGNLKQFYFKPYELQGRLFDVKQEIYRLPDRLIYNLGLIYGVQEESSWDTLDKLSELEKISAEGAGNLKEALTFATNLRLKTYAYYGHQKETMDFSKAYSQSQNEAEELIEEISKTFNLKSKDLKPGGALFEYYKVVLSLHNKLKGFCTKQAIENKDSFFASEEFYNNTPKTVASIHERLLQHKEALDQQLQELEDLQARLGLEHPDVATSLNNIGITYGALGNHQEALKYKLEALRLQEQLLGPEHPDAVLSLNNIGSTYGELGNYQEALNYLLKGLDLWQKILRPGHPSIALSLNNMGYTYGRLGNHKKALKYQLEALDLWQKVLEPDHPSVALSLNNVGITYGALGNHKDALKYLLEALELRQKVLGPEHPDVAISLNNVGYTHGELGNRVKALKYQLEALDLWRKVLGPEHPSVAASLNNVGGTYEELGNHQEALKCLLEALELWQKVLGPEHPDVAISLNNVGATYGDLGNHQEALKYKLEGLDLWQKLLGPEHPHVATSLNNVGMTYRELGNHQEALRYLLEALRLKEKLLGPDHPDVATSLNNVGATYGDLGNHQEALKCLLEALELWQKVLEPGHPSVALSLNNVGSTYGELGNHQEALKYKLEALELWQKVLGPDHPYVAKSLNNVGYTYGALGNHQKALMCQLEALELRQKVLGPEHPDVATCINDVACAYAALGRHQQALQYKMEAQELFKNILGSDHPYVESYDLDIDLIYTKLSEEEAYS